MLDRFCSSFDTQFWTVQAKLITGRIRPFFICIIIIITCTLFICLHDRIFGFCIRQIIQSCNSSDPCIQISMDKYADYIWIRLQSIICTASHKNTRTFVCNLLDCIKLCQKYFMVDWHICIRTSWIAHGICIHHQRIQKTVRRFLIMGLKNFLADSAFLCRTCQHLFIIKLDSKCLSNLRTNLSSGTSILPSYGNDRICLHNRPRSF